jgi:gamma-glutamyltranspeptidase/glutathione hydrolase
MWRKKYRLISSLGIPGTLAGLFQVHKNGSLPIAEILAPVIALAENGVVVTEFQAQSLTTEKLL